MQTDHRSWIKSNRANLLGFFGILGLSALCLFCIYFWLVITDRTGTFHHTAAVADLDGDGDLDVVLHNLRKEAEFTAFSVITLWLNQGDGAFAARRLGDPEFGPGMGSGWASAPGDLDLDGDMDLVVFPGYRLDILLNQGGGDVEYGKARTVSQLGEDGQFGSVALGDLDNDGLLDGIIAGCCGRQFTVEPEGGLPNISWVWINALDASGGLVPHTTVLSDLDGLALRTVALGDLDSDGDLDLYGAVIAPEGAQNTDQADRVLFNDGSGNFSDSGQRLGKTDTTAAALGDLDGDGDLDILGGTSKGAVVWLNQGGVQGGQAGRFALSSQEISVSGTQAVLLSDLDMDGDLDAVIAGPRRASIWWNDGAGAFTRSRQHFRYSRRNAFAIGDFNGDGRPDIFSAEYDTGYRLWLNQRDGTFR